MNPDNPYAAPQTPLELPELPVAVAVEPMRRRRLFQELDTLELRRVTDFSKALRYMRLLWLLGFAGCLGIGIGLLTRSEFSGGSLLLLSLPLIAGRLYADDLRSERARRYAQLIDFLACLGIVLAALVGGGILLGQGLEGISYCFAWLGFLFILGIFPLSSYSAHACAAELFGPERYTHRELLQEYKYRARFHVP
jgi:hypothetical protein